MTTSARQLGHGGKWGYRYHIDVSVHECTPGAAAFPLGCSLGGTRAAGRRRIAPPGGLERCITLALGAPALASRHHAD